MTSILRGFPRSSGLSGAACFMIQAMIPCAGLSDSSINIKLGAVMALLK